MLYYFIPFNLKQKTSKSAHFYLVTSNVAKVSFLWHYFNLCLFISIVKMSSILSLQLARHIRCLPARSVTSFKLSTVAALASVFVNSELSVAYVGCDAWNALVRAGVSSRVVNFEFWVGLTISSKDVHILLVKIIWKWLLCRSLAFGTWRKWAKLQFDSSQTVLPP